VSPPRDDRSAFSGHTRTDTPGPVIGFVGPSGAGKTTLLVGVLPLLRAAGLRTGVVKHAHHGFDLDPPGKDSHRVRVAGAAEVLLSTRGGWALLAATDDERPRLLEIVRRLGWDRLDLALVEGFQGEPYPKIEVLRGESARPVRYLDDPWVVAVAATGALPAATALPVLDLDSPERIASFVLAFARWWRAGPAGSRDPGGTT